MSILIGRGLRYSCMYEQNTLNIKDEIHFNGTYTTHVYIMANRFLDRTMEDTLGVTFIKGITHHKPSRNCSLSMN